MRRDKGLENIHSVIDRHRDEWRKQHGEEFGVSSAPAIEEVVRRRLTQENESVRGKFAADRFLNSSQETENEPEIFNEPESKTTGPNVEAVEVIKSKDEKHSWLYNEVMKAVKDAAGDGRNTKIIAIFVPVVQNGKEFEEIPNVESVTISPVEESALQAEDLGITPEEILPEQEQEPEPAPETETEQIPEPEAEEPEPEILPEPEVISEEPEIFSEEPAQELEPEQEIEPENSSDDFNLLPEAQEEPDAELADAFQTMEEKLDESLQNQAEQEQEPETEIILEEPPAEDIVLENEPEPEILPDPELLPELEENPEPQEESEPEIEGNSEGEKMSFAEIPLPPELDDEEIFEDVELMPEGEEDFSVEILPPDREQ